MGGFYLVRGVADAARASHVRRLEASFSEQGFGAPQRIEGALWCLGLYPDFHGRPGSVLRTQGEFEAASVGTLCYGGDFGDAGLRRLIHDFKGKLPPPGMLSGAFAVILHWGERLWILGDPIGLFRLYATENDAVLTSSFLAAAATLECPEVSDQGVYEYVFQEATFGTDTVLRDVRAVPAFTLHELTSRGFEARERFGLPEAGFDRRPHAHHADALLARIREIFGSVARSYGTHVSTALSGGFDSRLALAALLDRGVQPEVHVYGRPGDIDVRVAKTIAAGEGFPLEHVDKSRWVGSAPEAFAHAVRRNYLHFDGLPSDGVLDWGGDLATRLQRSAAGQLHVNGGGGEVMRNFFYLPGRDLSVRQFLWSFYARFDPRACTERFNEPRYLAALSEKVSATLDLQGQRIPRAQIELLYPFYRCRYWTGRNNSINSRFGREITPFLDYGLVERAVRLPLALKNYGVVEASLINALSPRLARYQSAYGYAFDHQPPLAFRIKAASTYLRPPAIRRLSFRVQNRSAARRAIGSHDADCLRAIVDPTLPRVSKWFRIARVGDEGHRRRMVSLEYFLARIDASV